MLKIATREVRGVVVLDLEGSLLLGASARSLRERVGELVKEGKTRILLNVEKVAVIDSTGAGTLVRCLNAVKTAGGDLKLANLNERFEEVMRLTHLAEVLELFETEEEALGSFG